MTYAAAAFVVLFLSNRFVARVPRIAGLALALLPLVFTGKAFLTGGVYGPADLYYGHDPWRETPEARMIGPVRNPILSDIAFANLPWRSAVREAFANGKVPFWDRFALSGSPLFPGAGDSFLHPGTWPGIFLPLELSFLFSCTFTLFLALVSAYLFFRDHELSPAPALVGAVAWGFSTFVVFWDGFAIGPAVSTFPLLLLSLRRLARRSGADSVALAVVALLLGLAGGHPETFFHCLAGGALYSSGSSRDGRGPARRPGRGSAPRWASRAASRSADPSAAAGCPSANGCLPRPARGARIGTDTSSIGSRAGVRAAPAARVSSLLSRHLRQKPRAGPAAGRFGHARGLFRSPSLSAGPARLPIPAGGTSCAICLSGLLPRRPRFRGERPSPARRRFRHPRVRRRAQLADGLLLARLAWRGSRPSEPRRS